MTTPADDTLTTKTVAERLGTDPKTLRACSCAQRRRASVQVALRIHR